MATEDEAPIDEAPIQEPARTAAAPGAGAADPAVRPVDVLSVTAVRDVTPAVRRVTLTAPAAVVAACGPTMSLLVPRADDRSPRWPQVARDGRIVWPQGSHGVALRSYTARRQDPGAGEVDVDFVLHGDGPAASWAAAATPGAVLGLASAAPLGASPAGWLLLAGDETALPAISRILAAAAPDTRGVALLEVAGPQEEQPLAAPAGVELRWLHRTGTAPEASTLLVDAVAALHRPPGEDLFAWVGAESAVVRAVRADLRGRWGLRRSQHHAIGYWRAGRAMSPAG
ncbi:siderophore-interacting protein [Modestobacter sp. VKM Ac-2979]|uniref:siderophore-interacting protein n=1 Tax=unclassified Modestobacter TaxID=2643866 RepID=UPI0022ABAD4E|nr:MULTISPECIES: siderophore-interacting protein [unclassified Modestobacter]MCZ2811412.1 siderophore-interacting protein [Modestobacter sp. VKM Ac-2979]MCZ2840925.1 siderophore-interacting protein [Modestobacter sp. VKM Ac-2980]